MRKITSALFLAFTGAFLLTACNKGEVDNLDDAPQFVQATLMDYTLGKYKSMRFSDGWSNGDPFDVTWSAKNVAFDEKGMSLSITKSGDTYYGGELATDGTDAFYQYGFFGTYMKPSPVKGTASTFFTYTGESDDQPHDEIDIEFLGQDTTKVQFNYFVDGKGGHEFMYDLGFDASKEYHQYGFYWSETSIVWYVDLKPVYRVRNTTLPTHKQRIFHNFWKGRPNVENWMGAFNDDDLGCSVCYTKSTYANLDGVGKDLELLEEEVIDLSNATNVDLTFDGNDVYTIAKKDGVTQVSYTEAEGSTYLNVFASIDAEVGKANNVFAVDLENKGQTTINARVDVNAAGQDCLNTRALVLGGDDVRTDLEWGGSFFTLQAGEKITAVIFYDGDPVELMMMLDTAYEETPSKHAGTLAISNARLALIGEKTPSKDPVEPTGEVRPLAMGFSSTDDYTIVAEDDVFDVTYTNVSFNSYANFSSGFIADEIEGASEISLKVQNLGEASVVVRFDVKNDAAATERAITATNCTGVRYDAEYGGVYMTIPAGVTSEVAITIEGTPEYMCIFLDSTWAEVTGDAHSGHLVFSDFGVR